MQADLWPTSATTGLFSPGDPNVGFELLTMGVFGFTRTENVLTASWQANLLRFPWDSGTNDWWKQRIIALALSGWRCYGWFALPHIFRVTRGAVLYSKPPKLFACPGLNIRDCILLWTGLDKMHKCMPFMDVPWRTEYGIRDLLLYMYVFWGRLQTAMVNYLAEFWTLPYIHGNFGIQISGLYRLGVQRLPRATMPLVVPETSPSIKSVL